jgi:hypothetical protein
MSRLHCALVATLVAACQAGPSPATPSSPDNAMTEPTDRGPIQALLDSYTRSVSTGDQALFESLLLDAQIPFFAVRSPPDESIAPSLQSIQSYASFRRSVFESGKKYAQTFSDVDIQQDGDLAQVSLRFRTIVLDSGQGAEGWKTLQLLRVAGRWKIASELYTVRAIAAATR